MAKLVEERYAQALFLAARESGQIDAYQKEVEALLNIFEEEKELMQFLLHPGVERKKKKRCLPKFFRGASRMTCFAF